MIEISIDQNSCIDADGNVYSTVKIGTQVWMAENLKTTKYNDGTGIERVTGNTDWRDLTTGARCEYNNDTDNSDIYGYLYNRYAVDTGKLAPSGWKVPALNDFKVLETFLGMGKADSDIVFGGPERGTNEGSKLSGNASLWANGDLENNSEFGASGFNVLPSGYRTYGAGTFSNINEKVYIWGSTKYGAENHRREIHYNHTTFHAGSGQGGNGQSVRCVKDDGEISIVSQAMSDISMASQAMSGISITIPPSYASSDRWDTFGIPWDDSKAYWAIT